MKDLQLKNLDLLIRSVKIENKNQINKWGIQDHTPYKWLAILIEEVGELAEGLLIANEDDIFLSKDNQDNTINEAIQVATLSLKIAEMVANLNHRN